MKEGQFTPADVTVVECVDHEFVFQLRNYLLQFYVFHDCLPGFSLLIIPVFGSAGGKL